MVRCKTCSCAITCWATDPQAQHLSDKKPVPPVAAPFMLTCSCCWSVWRYLEMEVSWGHPEQSENCRKKNAKSGSKTQGALLVAASTIAAIRLRGELIKPRPKLKSLIYDSISLARLVQGEIEK